MPIKDPIKRAAYHKAYMKTYLKNPEHLRSHLLRVANNKKNRRVAYQKVMAKFRASGCMVCGESESCCLDAHHLDPKRKDFTVSAMVHRHNTKISSIKAEVTKCVCLCKNCHAKVHARLITLRSGGVWSSPPAS